MAERADMMVLRIEVDNKRAKAKLLGFEKDVKKTAQVTKTATLGMRSAMLGVGAAIAGVAIAARRLDEFFESAEKISGVSRSFETLTSRIGENASLMRGAMAEASQGLISNQELMTQANNALLLGLPVTTESMAELTDMSVRLGRAMGITSTQGLNSLIVGIGRQSRMLLDNLGIIVSVEDANKTYAAQIGKTAAELTDIEQKQAFYNATVLAGRIAVDGLSDSSVRLSEIWRQQKVALGNLIDEYKRLVNEGAIPLLLQMGQGANQGGAGPRNIGAAFGMSLQGRSFPEILAQLLNQAAGGGGAVSAGGSGAVSGPVGPEFGPPLPPTFNNSGLGSIINAGTQVQQVQEDFQLLNEAVLRGSLNAEQMTAAYEALGTQVQELRELGFDPLPGVFERIDTAINKSAVELNNWTEAALRAFDTGQLMNIVFSATTDAFWAMSQGADVSAKSVLNAIAKQLFGVMAAKAIESTIFGIQETALAAGAYARYDYNAAIAHTASAALHFKTAALAGAGAAGALSIGAITRPDNQTFGSFGGAGNIIPDTQRPRDPVEITIFLDGQGFIEDKTAFARTLTTELSQQLDRAGVTTFGGGD